MATVRVFTAARMQEIENRSVVDGKIEVGEDSARNLVLLRHDGSKIVVGNIGGTGGGTDPGGGDPGGGTTPNTYTATYGANY